MKLEKRVQTFIEKHQLLAPKTRTLVAISGGADSVALLHILLRLGYHCEAVHCNFHLRGEESNRDETFTAKLCQALNVPYETVHFDTTAYATTRHISIEMAARELRYQAFERIRNERKLDIIAVGHHLDDSIETMLLNLIRGTGINGLTGIRKKNGYIVRPLLCLTRNEIIHYLDTAKQGYITDSSNLTDDYTRNKIRHQLIPLLQNINSAAISNITATISHLADAATLYNKAIADNTSRIVSPKETGIDIDITALLQLDTPQTHLFEILHPYGFNTAQTENIFQTLQSIPGKYFHSESHTLLKDRDTLQLRPNSKKPTDEELTIPLESPETVLPDGTRIYIKHLATNNDFIVPRDSNTLCLDPAHIIRPLTLRHPRKGDRFIPFGMKGSKLVSDYLTDLKLPRTNKASQWLLCHGEDILWIAGRRSDNRYRIDTLPKEIIIITIEETK